MTYTYYSLRTEHARTGSLSAYWEVSGDPISDDYTPAEIDAAALFDLWVVQIERHHPDGLIPIYWFVRGSGGTLEYFPHQLHNAEQDFLSYYTHPVSATTGEPLRWLALPVVDKRWRGRRADKGGFIQECTGWKPSILQPFVWLPALKQARAPS